MEEEKTIWDWLRSVYEKYKKGARAHSREHFASPFPDPEETTEGTAVEAKTPPVYRPSYDCGKKHPWGKWSEPEEVKIYNHGDSPDKDLPIRRDLKQKRFCNNCGLVELKVTHDQ